MPNFQNQYNINIVHYQDITILILSMIFCQSDLFRGRKHIRWTIQYKIFDKRYIENNDVSVHH